MVGPGDQEHVVERFDDRPFEVDLRIDIMSGLTRRGKGRRKCTIISTLGRSWMLFELSKATFRSTTKYLPTIRISAKTFRYGTAGDPTWRGRCLAGPGES